MRVIVLMFVATALVLSACDTGSSESATPEPYQGIVVERVTYFAIDDGRTNLIGPMSFVGQHEPLRAPGSAVGFLEALLNNEILQEAGGPDLVLQGIRFRLSIRDETGSYSVYTNAECLDAVRIGDPWPNAHEACR